MASSKKTIVIFIIILLVGLSVAAFFVISDKGRDVLLPEEEIVQTEPIVSEETLYAEAIVSSQRLATEAGFEILEKGGTAADAALAVAATLSVVESWFSSVLGGGTWALYYEAEAGKVTSLDGVGPVGSLASVADYRARANTAGIHQSNVPGAWDGWMLWLERYGKLDLGEVLFPAIEIARNGYPASSQMASWLDRLSSEVLSRPDSVAIYAPQGVLVRQGTIVFQHNLADTFQALVSAYDTQKSEGRSRAIQAARDYYYRGPLAEAIVEYSDLHGGYLTLEDFNNFEAQIVEPLSIDYNDEITVFENPPNSQGIVMLLALNILKDYDFSDFQGPDDADAVHLQAEAVKLAIADKYYYVGDPERINVPVQELLSEEHASDQRQRIDMGQAMTWPIDDILNIEQDSHTTTFHITDRYGNAAAVTTSLGAEFLVVGDTGIHINNRMRMISLDEGDPNQLTPGYKVRHTSNPYMALLNGRPYIMGGNTGVDTQPQGQMQQFLHIVEFGLSAQQAIDRPRFVSTAFPSGAYPYSVGNTLQLEQGFPSDTIQELRTKGHVVTVGTGTFGIANMLVVLDNGLDVDIGADSRSDTAFGKKNLFFEE